MNCMKCGRKIEPGQCFCPECLGEMEKYPVKPGVVVQLPARPRHTAPKRNPSRRRAPSAQEQVTTLKKRVRGLWAALILSWALLAAAGAVVVEHLLEVEPQEVIPGQNYSTAGETNSQEAE